MARHTDIVPVGPPQPAAVNARVVLTALLLLTLQACSFSYEDQNGATHILGVHAMTLRAPDSATVAGQIAEFQTLGLAYHHLADGRTLSVGYSRDVVGYLKNDVAVVGNPHVLLDPAYTCQPKEKK